MLVLIGIQKYLTKGTSRAGAIGNRGLSLYSCTESIIRDRTSVLL